jgi:diguanylate cyclase (GGDEF)-like protein/PAS domain S-box-containing protein
MNTNMAMDWRSVWGRAWASSWRLLSVACALLLLGCLLALLAIASRAYERRATEVVTDLEHSQTRRLANLVASRVVNLQRALTAAAEGLGPQRLGDPGAAARYLREQDALMTLFRSVVIATPDGALVSARVDANIVQSHANLADRPYFQRAFRENQPTVSEPFVGRLINVGLIGLAVPIRDAALQPVGVFVGTLDLTGRGLGLDFDRRGIPDEETGVRTVIIDATGRIIFHSESQHVLRNASELPDLAPGIDIWTRQGQPIEPQGLSHIRNGYVLSTSGVVEAGWVVMRVSPAGRLFEGLARARQYALGAALLVWLTGALLLALLLYRAASPWRNLARHAVAMVPGAVGVAEGSESARIAKALDTLGSERQAREDEAQSLRAVLDATLAHAPMVMAVERGRRMERVSQSWAALFGYRPEELEGQHPQILFASPEVYREFGPRVMQGFTIRGAFDAEIQMLRRDGSSFWALVQAVPINPRDLRAGAIWTLSDVSAERAQRERSAGSAARDPLTGCLSRRAFEWRVAEALDAAVHGAGASVVWIDLNGTGRINDRAGLAVGDQLLKAVADALGPRVRGGDAIGRAQGDVFVVLLADCPASAARAVIGKLREAVAQARVRWRDEFIGTTASIGVADVNARSASVDAILRAAEADCEASRGGDGAAPR